MPDVAETILEHAMEPAASGADGQSATDRPVADKIAAAQFAATKTAARRRRRGLRFSKLIPSGPMPDGGAACGPGSFGGM